MGNWLERLLPPPSKGQGKTPNLPMMGGGRPIQNFGGQRLPPGSNKIPNASLIYGIGATIMAVMAVYFLVNGQWFTALVIMFPAICLFAFAFYFTRYTGN